MKTVINWFEIPTDDHERGIRCYETVPGVTQNRQSMGTLRMAMFSREDMAAAGGAVIDMESGTRPGPLGTVVYLNGGDDLSVPLARVEAAGGRILVPRTPIPPDVGYFAVFSDTDGNHVGQYSQH